jgi:hypothetical protein
MSIPQLLLTMCAGLSDTDLNAIRKGRGFSASETASRSSFASFFVTSIGVEAAMRALTLEEGLALRLLHETGEVDVTFFERVYGAGGEYDTYTQRYKPTFDQVKKNLVRRGLVIMAEIKMPGDTVQLERWRFALPPEFASYLPALPGLSLDQPGQTNDYALRKKLLELVGGLSAVPNDPFPIQIKQGSLFLKETPFSLATLGLWQSAAWQAAMNVSKPSVPASLSPIDATLKLLSPEIWTAPQALDPALKIFCFGSKLSSAEELLQNGWKLGLLARLEIGSVRHYRLIPSPNPAGRNAVYPASIPWADLAARSGSVKIDLRLIPLSDLEELNIIAHLAVEKGVLFASASLIKLGLAAPAQRNSPLSRWLAERVPAFGRVAETVQQKWGKTILHENLLVARVRDLSLRVQLERELGPALVVLSDHFIAFPLEARPSVEKVLKKTGFVTKTIQS